MFGVGRRRDGAARSAAPQTWSLLAMLGAAVVVAGVLVAAPVAHAQSPEGATVTVTPSMDLPADSASSVDVVGNYLYPNTTVEIDECEITEGSDCDVVARDKTNANDHVEDVVDVSYALSGGGRCDSAPDGSPSCELDVIYTSGQNSGVEAASAPLSFAGHDGSDASSLAFDPAGEPVDTQVGKTMSGPDRTATHILVDVENSDGSIVAGYAGAVTIAFTQPNQAEFVTAGGSAAHTPSLTVDAVDGVADFSPIVIDTVGFGDTLVATADGLTQSAPSASFDVASAATDCPAGKTCTVHATSPGTGQSATVKAVGGAGTPGTVVTASFGGNVAPLQGCSTPAAGILTFNGNRQKIVKLTVATTTYIGTFCYGQPAPFIDQTGSETTYFSSANQEYEGVLGFCSGATIPPPCINKITVMSQSETVKVTGGPGDPRISH